MQNWLRFKINQVPNLSHPRDFYRVRLLPLVALLPSVGLFCNIFGNPTFSMSSLVMWSQDAKRTMYTQRELHLQDTDD